MAQFLHLSLLLGTIQLFVVLATYVSCQDWKIERCCWFKNNQTTCESSDIDIEKNKKKVHIKNFKQQCNDYQLCCYTTSKLKLNLSKEGENGVKVHFLDSNFTGELKLEYKCGGQLDLEVKNSCSGKSCDVMSAIRPHNATIIVQPPMKCDGKTNGDGNKKALKFYWESKSWIDALLHYWDIKCCGWFKNGLSTNESSRVKINDNNKKLKIEDFNEDDEESWLYCITTSSYFILHLENDGAGKVKAGFFGFNLTQDQRIMCKKNSNHLEVFSGSCSGGTCVDVSLICPDDATITVYPPMKCDGKINALKFYRERKSWIDALLHCEREKTILVQITNQTVERAVSTLLTNKTLLKDGVWVGLERPIFGCDVTWKWTSKINFNVSHWDGSFPVNRSNYHCGKIILIKETQEFKFVDGYCHEELPFICQGFTEILLESNGGSSYP